MSPVIKQIEKGRSGRHPDGSRLDTCLQLDDCAGREPRVGIVPAHHLPQTKGCARFCPASSNGVPLAGVVKGDVSPGAEAHVIAEGVD